MLSLPLLIGWLLDRLFGDPPRLPHPIVWFGRLISFGEQRLNRGEHRKRKGAVFALCCIVLVFCLTNALLASSIFIPYHLGLPYWVGISLYIAFSGVLVFYCLAGTTLRREVQATFEATDRSVEEGRRQVSRIVGRDTSNLSPQQVRTAALETLAENLSDGVIAPLFWFFFLGVPGMMTYKMINTLDSMIGYRTQRYKDFGCWAARIDDYANYLPARLTALLVITTGKLMAWKQSSFRKMMSFLMYYGPKHASPNSGWCEAALAAVLDCQFGGGHNYFGEYFHKPYIGHNPHPLTTADMRKSIDISLWVEKLLILLMIIYLTF